jgi:hypothetical protein
MLLQTHTGVPNSPVDLHTLVELAQSVQSLPGNITMIAYLLSRRLTLHLPFPIRKVHMLSQAFVSTGLVCKEGAAH